MLLSNEQLSELTDLASRAAREAGDVISEHLGKSVYVSLKEAGGSLASQVVTEVDMQCDALISKYLLPSVKQYELALLTEERDDDGQRLVKDYFWCVDPLDGTLAFSEARPGYAVSIALVSRQGDPVIGVIYDPVQQILYSAIKGMGAKRNGKCWLPLERKKSEFVFPCDRSMEDRTDYLLLKRSIDNWTKKRSVGEIRLVQGMGAVMNACFVLEQAPGCYFKLPKTSKGGGSIWDFAASVCIFNEVGGVACNFDGKPLELNSVESTFMNKRGVIFATDEEIVEFVRTLKHASEIL